MPDTERPYELEQMILEMRAQIRGLSVAPGLPQNLPWRPSRTNDGPWVYLTSGAWTPAFDTTFAMITADAIQVRATVSAPAGTTLEVRLHHVGFNLDSAVRTVTGGQISAVWAWQPGWEAAIGSYGITNVQLQARRTAGSGDVAIYWPEAIVAPADQINATPTGV